MAIGAQGRGCEARGGCLKQNLQAKVLAEIDGGAWHTTSEGRYRRILETGAILPEPSDVPEAERWGEPLNSPYVNYVRGLGGVSLFEFIDFDPDAYDKEFPMSSWRTFVPRCKGWDAAVWIEIDRQTLGESFISATNLRARWRTEGTGQRFMPMIEGAHIGPIPTTAFLRAFLVREKSTGITPLDLEE